GSLHERLFHEAVDPIVLEDLDGRILDANPSAADAFGWTREELIGQPFTVLVPHELCSEEATLRRRCISGARPRRVRRLWVGKDGVPFEFALSLSLLHGDDGAPVAIAARVGMSPAGRAAVPGYPSAVDPRLAALGAWADVVVAGVFDIDLI